MEKDIQLEPPIESKIQNAAMLSEEEKASIKEISQKIAKFIDQLPEEQRNKLAKTIQENPDKALQSLRETIRDQQPELEKKLASLPQNAQLNTLEQVKSQINPLTKHITVNEKFIQDNQDLKIKEKQPDNANANQSNEKRMSKEALTSMVIKGLQESSQEKPTIPTNNSELGQKIFNPSILSTLSPTTQPNPISQTNTTNYQTLQATTAAMDVKTPVGEQGWDKNLGAKLVWMVNKNIQQAEIRLNPAHLGPVEVKITMQKDQATVMFTAQQIATRDALELALPKLKEMLEQEGIELKDANVSDQGFKHQHAHDEKQSKNTNFANNGNPSQDIDDENQEPQTIFVKQGLIDDYA